MSALVVAIGVPGSGKSTWLGCRFSRTQIVTLDELRGLVADDEGDQAATPDAVAVQNLILTARCRRRLLTVVDDTNSEAEHRGALLALAAEHGMPAIAVVFDTPLEVALLRNSGRTRQVPPPVIVAMRDRITAELPASGPVPGFDQTLRVTPDGFEIFGTSPVWDPF